MPGTIEASTGNGIGEMTHRLTLQSLKRAFVQKRGLNELGNMRHFKIAIERRVKGRHMSNGDWEGASRLARASYPKDDIFGSLESWWIQDRSSESTSGNQPEGGLERSESVSPGWQVPTIEFIANRSFIRR